MKSVPPKDRLRRELINDGLAGLEPSDEQEARVRAAVMAGLAVSATAASTATASAATAAAASAATAKAGGAAAGGGAGLSAVAGAGAAAGAGTAAGAGAAAGAGTAMLSFGAAAKLTVALAVAGGVVVGGAAIQSQGAETETAEAAPVSGGAVAPASEGAQALDLTHSPEGEPEADTPLTEGVIAGDEATEPRRAQVGGALEARRPRGRRVSRAGRSPAAAETPADNLASEVAILQRAQGELQHERYRAALRTVAASRDARLAPERGTIRVLALCGLGRTNEARRVAESLRASARSVALSRLANSCVAD